MALVPIVPGESYPGVFNNLKVTDQFTADYPQNTFTIDSDNQAGIIRNFDRLWESLFASEVGPDEGFSVLPPTESARVFLEETLKTFDQREVQALYGESFMNPQEVLNEITGVAYENMNAIMGNGNNSTALDNLTGIMGTLGIEADFAEIQEDMRRNMEADQLEDTLIWLGGRIFNTLFSEDQNGTDVTDLPTLMSSHFSELGTGKSNSTIQLLLKTIVLIQAKRQFEARMDELA